MDHLCFLCLVFVMPLCVSVYMCFVVTCWERAAFLALVCGVYCESVTLPNGILGQVWYLIVSIPDLCTLTYFETYQDAFMRLSLNQETRLKRTDSKVEIFVNKRHCLVISIIVNGIF